MVDNEMTEYEDKRRRHVLTPAQVEWAYEKWCLGYTLAQIAEALHVSSRTVSREFELLCRPRVRPKLIYGG